MAWQDGLQPASFRGVPFLFRAAGQDGGQRLAVFEFPERDSPSVQPLGRRVRRFSIRAYVLGDDYFQAREDLLTALEDSTAEPGTFVHPYRGTLQVYCERYRLSEEQEQGRTAAFDLSFVEAGSVPSPVSFAASPDAATAQVATVQATLADAFTAGFSVSNVLGSVEGAAADIVGEAQTAIAAALDIAGTGAAVAADVAGLGVALVRAPAALAASLIGLADDYAAAIVAAFPAPPPIGLPAGPTETSSRAPAGVVAVADPSFGLAALAGFGAALPSVATVTPAGAQTARNQALLMVLVQGAAVAGLATIYAQTNFQSLEDAEAARDQLTGFIDAQILASDAALLDDLTAAWAQLYAASANDLTARGLALPDVITFSAAMPLPAVVVAEQLYQDASRGYELVARNNAPHPLFLPLQVEALAS